MDNRLEIKKRVKISDYIKTDLKETTQGFHTLSPFSNEKTPSFFIKNDNGIEVFKCFSTGKSGDIFSFLMTLENKTFSEVYNDLCEKLKLPIEGLKIKTAQKPYIDLLEKLNIWFQYNLTEFPDAVTFLQDDRGLTDDTIKEFGLGWVNDDLLEYIDAESMSKALLLEVGVLGKKTSYYPVLKNRIIIPLLSPTGNTIGFGTRKYFDTDTYAKYMLPPNNVIYKKGGFLYNVDKAKDHIKSKDYVILFEGFFDVITAYQNGIKNTVAINGTSMYSSQVKLLQKLTNNFYICLDNDAPGLAAIMKNCKELIKNGVDIHIVELANGLDPDEYIRTYGVDEFQKQINNAKSIFEFIAELGENQIEVLEEIALIVLKIPSEIRRQFWYKSIEDRTGINIRNNIKKSFYETKVTETLSQNDGSFLFLYINADDNTKPIVEEKITLDTNLGKLLYLKLKNKKYSIEYTDKEKQILDSLTIQKPITEETIKKELEKILEKKYFETL